MSIKSETEYLLLTFLLMLLLLQDILRSSCGNIKCDLILQKVVSSLKNTDNLSNNIVSEFLEKFKLFKDCHGQLFLKCISWYVSCVCAKFKRF